jgi:SAM-dependent methyltransferase
MRRDVTTDLDALERLIDPAGKDVVDVGCGPGILVRKLRGRGARVIGLEVSEEQLAPALAQDDEAGARYVVGSAQDLPFDDSSMDVVIFMRSLHHISPADQSQALREARRVLRTDGAVYVAEPLPEGSHFALTSLVEDEVEVRAAAQRALAASRSVGLERVRTVEYEVRARLAGVNAFRDRTVTVDPSRAEIFAQREAEITATFERVGVPGDRPGERWFEQPMRADLLRPLRR